jgi:hypothetical protein
LPDRAGAYSAPDILKQDPPIGNILWSPGRQFDARKRHPVLILAYVDILKNQGQAGFISGAGCKVEVNLNPGSGPYPLGMDALGLDNQGIPLDTTFFVLRSHIWLGAGLQNLTMPQQSTKAQETYEYLHQSGHVITISTEFGSLYVLHMRSQWT